ncbi:MAG: tRNA (N(6)-L-threonylcarbamoyladenosine(37)-C(2))-methylthiotransferase MtaB [Candidatus Omnitrophica bacterium]|nr:tRNA (N(6)-L-threonylcarbamoyladenosine(37)-C(2))-methylthiotransferase MtaB [Candidatus Omnitrophota bacterium]
MVSIEEKKKKVKFYTLGCKVNQYETQAMREALHRVGFESVHENRDPGKRSESRIRGSTVQFQKDVEGVDFVVVNTCTVTAGADKDSRYLIRKARRDFPNAKIVITGCGVERNREAYERLEEKDLILEHESKPQIADYLTQADSCGGAQRKCLDVNQVVTAKAVRPYMDLSISDSEGRTRAFVKIQDGCNHACTFCSVVLARGRSRSRPFREIIEEAKRLRDKGYREIVLTGIQLGAYGKDNSQKENRLGLIEVLQECSRIEGIERLRLSAIEPTDIGDELIQVIQSEPKICPHLHIPLQSGADFVLKRMNRRYQVAYYLERVAKLREAIRDFKLSLDIMAGFPGEEEKHFQETIQVLKAVSPMKCHVFPYSRRQGTAAARMEDLPQSVIRQRVHELIKLEAELGEVEKRPFLARTMTVLVEEEKVRLPKPFLRLKDMPIQKRGNYSETLVWQQGFTSNYMRVVFRGKESWQGRMIPVRLTALADNLFLGEALDS